MNNLPPIKWGLGGGGGARRKRIWHHKNKSKKNHCVPRSAFRVPRSAFLLQRIWEDKFFSCVPTKRLCVPILRKLRCAALSLVVSFGEKITLVVSNGAKKKCSSEGRRIILLPSEDTPLETDAAFLSYDLRFMLLPPFGRSQRICPSEGRSVLRSSFQRIWEDKLFSYKKKAKGD